MNIGYKPSFVRQYKKLSRELQEEALEKIALFKNPKNHSKLRVHKLKGPLARYSSFSINFKYRVVFQYAKDTAILLAIGDHDVYQ